MDLTGTGIWAHQLRYGDAGAIRDVAAELDQLGYDALWIPDVGGDVLGAVDLLLDAAPRAVVATGVLNVWMHEPADVAAHIGKWDDTRRARFLLGPRMLELARDRAAGAHPYFVPAEHVAAARRVLNPTSMIAVEQAVVLDTDPSSARAAARRHTGIYTMLPNYTNNLRRFGFDDADFADAGSDRLVDAVVAWGDLDAISARVQLMRDAGADHVCIQVIRADDETPRADWRELASALLGR